MVRDEVSRRWFGDTAPIGELPESDAAAKLRELGDDQLADELAAAAAGGSRVAFSGFLDGLFNRFMKTTHLCGFLPAEGDDSILPVTRVEPDRGLVSQPLKITLDGLHVARYPGGGEHRLLFDFALQSQIPAGDAPILHYNAKFRARNGETVPVRNFPLFFGLAPSAEGITFGFQTVNVSSSIDEGLLSFLGRDDFKKGLTLLTAATPVLGQISEMAASLTGWLAGQSRNAKVQEFRQGLDFRSGPLGGGLAEGSYIVAQIPVEHAGDWTWDDWHVDPALVRLARRGDTTTELDFNHMIFGIHRMA